ncbi:MAG: hypothetical protein D6679_02855 [Candidatus Hydrogenedentota bacterium]|nr:MAG: hypothetical protein D6679_02855 [Candidatus Hydrogenedentota bacterium]
MNRTFAISKGASGTCRRRVPPLSKRFTTDLCLSNSFTGLLQVACRETTENTEDTEKSRRKKERRDRRRSFSGSEKPEERVYPARKKGKEKSECGESAGFFGSLPFFISSSVISVALWFLPFFGHLQNSGPLISDCKCLFFRCRIVLV